MMNIDLSCFLLPRLDVMIDMHFQIHNDFNYTHRRVFNENAIEMSHM